MQCWSNIRIAKMLSLIAILLVVQRVCAMQASPFPFTVQQPDGASVALFLRGNEHRNSLQDPNGFTVVQTSAGDKPLFVYATQDPASGQLMPSQFIVGTVSPAAVGLAPNLVPPPNPLFSGSTGASPLAGTGSSTGDISTPFGGSSNGQLLSGGLLSVHRRGADDEQITRVRRLAAKGTVKNLVLMVRWADCPFKERNGTTPGLPTIADLDPLFNNATNSVRDVYRVNSYGTLDIVSVFTGWITVSSTEATAAAGQSGLSCCTLQDALTEALTKADATVNFSDFDKDGDKTIDMITIVHSGYGAEWGGADYGNRIWSHKWGLPTPFTSAEGVQVSSYHISPAMWGTSGTELGRIGVIAHESGHFFGLPDLYDVDGYNGQYVGQGLGSYSLMANSWGFNGDQKFPPLMDAWSRIQMGFVRPTPISAAGTYSVTTATVPGSQVYKITKGFPEGEYLLIENRQPLSYDSMMPQGGLAIYHVDEKTADFYDQGFPGQTGYPQNGKHYRVALLQADGLFQLESTAQRGDAGDVWYVGGKNVLSPNSVPNTNAYQGGKVVNSGVTVTVTSAPGNVMTFTVSFAAPAPTCNDGIKNQGETGIDCGGPRCKACPSCFDGIKNQNEAGVDCGGICAKKCPTCFDGIKNQNEEGIDCGGVCAKKCIVPSMRVAALALSQTRPSATAAFTAQAAVRVMSATNTPITGALVSVRFTRVSTNKAAAVEFRTGYTTAAGTVIITSGVPTPTADSTLVACVAAVTKAGFQYTVNSNVVTCRNLAGKTSKILVTTL